MFDANLEDLIISDQTSSNYPNQSVVLHSGYSTKLWKITVSLFHFVSCLSENLPPRLPQAAAPTDEVKVEAS
jgi:hypothetical protein